MLEAQCEPATLEMELKWAESTLTTTMAVNRHLHMAPLVCFFPWYICNLFHYVKRDCSVVFSLI